jgi:hypothetical protein
MNKGFVTKDQMSPMRLALYTIIFWFALLPLCRGHTQRLRLSAVHERADFVIH